jgi:uncharacterized membrane protein
MALSFRSNTKIPVISRMRFNVIKYISFLTCLFISSQIAYLVYKGESFCIDEGCAIVEQMASIPPLYLNSFGFFYFFMILILSILTNRRYIGETLLRIILIFGVTGMGISLSFQIYVANNLCSYCFFVFIMVLLLNLLAGARQAILSTGIVTSQLLFFSFFSFPASGHFTSNLSIHDGTYAVKNCEKPQRRLFLLFSEDCPHCHKVMEELKNCTSCEFHFNPVKNISSDILPGLTPIPSYKPEVNRAALSILNINSIPVLIAENKDGLTFIKGDKNIIQFIQNFCGIKNPFEVFEEDPILKIDEKGAEEACRMEEKCKP